MCFIVFHALGTDKIAFMFFFSGITGKEELPKDVSRYSGAQFYPWTIDNKYYSADIHFCVVKNEFLVTPEIAESVQAFLVYFDSTTVSTSGYQHCLIQLMLTCITLSLEAVMPKL